MRTEEKTMTADKLVLLIIDEADGRLRGKTLLQKRAYFLSKELGLELNYRPHYYGPYSPDLEEGLSRAKALGFVQEQKSGFGADQIGFEVCRYDYSLTEDGKEIVKTLRSRYSTECERIDQCLKRLSKAGDKGDYVSLSIAAKAYHILTEKGKPMTSNDIRSEAKKIGWKIEQQSLENAVSFLEKMDLVKTARE
jgi:uncharacterized protein YwgA